MGQRGPSPALRLHRWIDPALIGVALVSLSAGFGQFGAVAALGDVARSFGHLSSGTTIADQAGLSGTELGLGLAVLRLASLGGLPLAGLADRFGRRRVLLGCCALGLAFTIASAASPGYWWFVAIFGLGRPLLSATGAIGPVIAAEETDSHNRARAVALVTGGYGLGSGLTALLHGAFGSALGFRGLFALAGLPLISLLFTARLVVESDRFMVARGDAGATVPILGAIAPPFRRRLVVVSLIAFSVAMCSGPANGFVFLYGQNVLHLAGSTVALMVLAAGGAGLAGLVAGQWLADHLGRRGSGAILTVVVSGAAMLVYSGGRTALLTGYVGGVAAASMFAPAAGALANELFPTAVRASVSGWLIVASVLGAVVGLLGFGAVADLGERFSLAGYVAFSPAILAAGMFFLVPETKGREPEETSTSPSAR